MVFPQHRSHISFDVFTIRSLHAPSPSHHPVVLSHHRGFSALFFFPVPYLVRYFDNCVWHCTHRHPGSSLIITHLVSSSSRTIVHTLHCGFPRAPSTDLVRRFDNCVWRYTHHHPLTAQWFSLTITYLAGFSNHCVSSTLRFFYTIVRTSCSVVLTIAFGVTNHRAFTVCSTFRKHTLSAPNYPRTYQV